MTGFSSMGVGSTAGIPSPTMCEVAYDSHCHWYTRPQIPPYRFYNEWRSPVQEFLGSAEHLLPHCEDSHSENKTRSFTSLGVYNLPKTPLLKDSECRRNRASSSLWESRSQWGTQVDPNRTQMDPRRTHTDTYDLYSREAVCVSPNGELPGAPVSDHSRLRWVDALSSWVPDKRPSQAFVTFVQGAPVRQRAASPSYEDSARAHLSPSHEMCTTLPGLDRPGQKHHKSAAHARRVDLVRTKPESAQRRNSQVHRSNTVALSQHISQKRSRVRFLSTSRQSPSSSVSYPPAPPPTMTPSQSAESSRASAALFKRMSSWEATAPPVVLEAPVEEEGLVAPDTSREDLVEKPLSVGDVSSIVSSHKSYSMQGSNSSVVSDAVLQSVISSKSHDPYVKHERKKTENQVKKATGVRRNRPETTGVIEDRWGTKRKDFTTINHTTARDQKKNEKNKKEDIMPCESSESTETKPSSDDLTPQVSVVIECETAVQTSGVWDENENLVLNHSHHSNPANNTQPTTKRKPIQKKKRKERNVEDKKVEEKVKTPSPPPSLVSVHQSDSGNDELNLTEEEDEVLSPRDTWPPRPEDSELRVTFSDMSLPQFPDKTPKSKTKVKNHMSLPTSAGPEKKLKQRKDSVRNAYSTFDEERRRQELGEKRRKKQKVLLEQLKLKSQRQTNAQTVETSPEEEEDHPRFEDYDFLAKYCIFGNGTYELYRDAFDSVNPTKPWLTRQQVLKALKSLNTKLSQIEDAYLKRILELVGYDVSRGADLKLFSVIAALSKRIAALDPWMKTIMGSLDLKSVELKLFLWKTLWECNVNPNWNTISVDQLCVELRAGGVSEQHENEVRHKLGHLNSLDLLDFLTYLPLFIMIHESVIENPLSDTREK